MGPIANRYYYDVCEKGGGMSILKINKRLVIAARVKRVDYLLLVLLLLLLSSSSSSFDWQSSLADNWYHKSFEGKRRTNGCQSRREFPDMRDLFSQVYSRKKCLLP